MKYHPDRNKSPGAEAKFRDIAEAYETLSDEKRRQEYDRLGHRSFRYEGTRGGTHQHFPQPFNFDFEEFFKEFDVYGQDWHEGEKKQFEKQVLQHREAHSPQQDSLSPQQDSLSPSRTHSAPSRTHSAPSRTH
ncbi:hypothetical protein AAFF_G00212920, partial [Aldrovandia affinis]